MDETSDEELEAQISVLEAAIEEFDGNDSLAERYARLRLDDVDVYESQNIRKTPYSREEIEARAAQLEEQPLLHPPTVFRRPGGRFELVAGYGRFLALRHLGREEAMFRLVDKPDRRTRLMLMGAENLVRKEMSGADRVEYVWQLIRVEQVPTAEVAAHLGLTERYVRSLVSVREDACMELMVAFEQEKIPIRRMMNLVAHPAEEQMARLRDGSRWARRAASIDQGFVEYLVSSSEDDEQDDGFLDAYHGGRLPSFKPDYMRQAEAAKRKERRRAPSVREQRQMLEALDEVTQADPLLLEGMRRVFRWSVYGEDIPELPATAFRRARRNARRRERRAEKKRGAQITRTAGPKVDAPPPDGPAPSAGGQVALTVGPAVDAPRRDAPADMVGEQVGPAVDAPRTVLGPDGPPDDA